MDGALTMLLLTDNNLFEISIAIFVVLQTGFSHCMDYLVAGNIHRSIEYDPRDRLLTPRLC